MKTSKTAATELMRIAWRTVGAIITRVWADTEALHDPFAGLTRIGIDEVSFSRAGRTGEVEVARGADKSGRGRTGRRPGIKITGSLGLATLARRSMIPLPSAVERPRVACPQGASIQHGTSARVGRKSNGFTCRRGLLGVFGEYFRARLIWGDLPDENAASTIQSFSVREMTGELLALVNRH